MSGFEVLLGLVVGLVIGSLGVWFAVRSRLSMAEYQASDAQKEATRLATERATFQERSKRVDGLEDELRQRERALERVRDDFEELRVKHERLEGEMLSDRRSFEERKAELDQTVKEAEQRFQDAFKALASEALGNSNKQFLELAKETMEKYQEQAKGELDKKHTAIDTLIKPLSESLEKYELNLKQLEEKQSERDHKTAEQIQQLVQGVRLQQNTMADLKGLLKGPTSRGRMGEIFLKRMLEAAGLEEGLHYEMQVTENTEAGRQRPDCIVKMPNSKALVIDCKTPLNAYEDSLGIEDEAARLLKLKEHATNVRRQVDSLAKRSYTDLSIDADLVVMYLPIEASLSAALQIDPEINSYGWDKRVIVTTPTLLYALLQIVALDWRQESIRKNAEQITQLGKEMVDRIRIVAGHFRKIGSGLKTAADGYNDALGSLERNLLTSAKKFQKLGTGRDSKIEAVVELANHVDDFKKPELLELPSKDRIAELTLFDDAVIEDVVDEPVQVD